MGRYITMTMVDGQYFVAFKDNGKHVSSQYYDRMDDMTWDVSSFLGGVDKCGDAAEERMESMMLHGTEG